MKLYYRRETDNGAEWALFSEGYKYVWSTIENNVETVYTGLVDFNLEERHSNDTWELYDADAATSVLNVNNNLVMANNIQFNETLTFGNYTLTVNADGSWEIK